MWAMKTVAEAITAALVTTLEAHGRQVRSLSITDGQTQLTFFEKTDSGNWRLLFPEISLKKRYMINLKQTGDKKKKDDVGLPRINHAILL